MTLEQINVFLTVAKHMNFTKASELLFMTQPNISRSISSLEKELNMQLFIRSSHNLRLTPAGKVLFEEFSDSMDHIQNAIQKASDMNQGILGEVRIGVLSGTDITDFMPRLISYFQKEYPQIKIVLYSYSFRDLLTHLYDESLDLVFTLEFNLQDRKHIAYDILEETQDNIVIPKNSPLYEKENISIEDLDQQDVIFVSPDDMDLTSLSVLELFKEHHIGPVLHYVPNLDTSILWLQSGVGVAFLFSRSMYASSDQVRCVPIDSPWKTNFIIGRYTEHMNPAAEKVYDYCINIFK